MSIKELFGKNAPPAVGAKKQPSVVTCEQQAITWVDVQDASPHDLAAATREYPLHAAHLGQCLHKGQVAQLHVETDYIFLLLHVPYAIPEERRIGISQVSLFLGKDFLVTVHGSANSRLREVFANYAAERPTSESDNEHHQPLMQEPETPADVLRLYVELLIQDATALVELVMDELDEVETNVFDDRNSDAYQIGKIRQNIMRLERTLVAQKSVLSDLDDVIDGFSGQQLKRYYLINTNASRKLLDTVEEARETIEIYKDADFTTSTERTNQILAVLTLLFTLTIPATVIGTFYGMNVLLPGGVEAGAWTFLGEYTTLKLIVAISFASALLMYAYFKDRKWF